MQYSKNGKWIIDDNRYQFVIQEDGALFLKILRYQNGFNSITFVIENFDGKEKEQTVPRHYFKRISENSIENAMVRIVRLYDGQDLPYPDIRQRLFEYRTYLEKNYPEKLI